MQLKGGDSSDASGGQRLVLGALTFTLSHDRKGTFAILGRGHIRVLGGGARGLGCSSHVRGGDVAVVDKDDLLWYSGLSSHFTLHTKRVSRMHQRALAVKVIAMLLNLYQTRTAYSRSTLAMQQIGRAHV